MDDLTLMQRIAVWALPVLFAITVHEVAHGWVAKLRGDKTAWMLGRLTLNPIKHIDPMGTIVIPGVLLALGGFVFGWAKPVPVTQKNLHNPKQDMIWVAIAGPMANLLMAIAWALVARFAIMFAETSSWIALPLVYMGLAGITINVVLMVLNLLPIPPLDGGRVISGLLPGPLSYQFDRIEPFGFIILIILLATGLLGMILQTPVVEVHQLIYSLLGL